MKKYSAAIEFLYLVVLLLCVVSCSTAPVGKITDYSDYEVFRPMLEDYTQTKNVDSLIKEAINRNDEKSLKDIFANMHFHGNLHKCYYYLQIIANKNQSSFAYYYLYASIVDYYRYEIMLDSSIYPMDSCTKFLAFYFLAKSNELGNEYAGYDLLSRYVSAENIPPLEEFRKKICW